MADEDNTTAQTTPAALSTDSPAAASPQEPPPVQSDHPPPTDRTELIQRARAFLTSPQVRHEDAVAKRRFLAEKGLTDAEIEGLLYEVVRGVSLASRLLAERWVLAPTRLATPCASAAAPDISPAAALKSAIPAAERLPRVHMDSRKLRRARARILRASCLCLHAS